MKIALPLLTSMFLLLGCGDGGAGAASGSAAASGKPAGSAKSAASSATSAAPAATSAAPAPAATAELEEVKNEKMGYSLMLPKGTKNESPDEAMSGSYAAGKVAVLVTVLFAEAKSPDDLLRGLDEKGAKVEKKTDGDLFTAHFDKGDGIGNFLATRKGAKFMVQCLGEAKDLEESKKICSSLKLLKK